MCRWIRERICRSEIPIRSIRLLYGDRICDEALQINVLRDPYTVYTVFSIHTLYK